VKIFGKKYSPVKAYITLLSMGVGALFTATNTFSMEVFNPVSPETGLKSTKVVQKIEIEGNHRVESASIISYLSLKEGDLLDPEAHDQSLRNLFSTGLFSDVSLHFQGNVLHIKVIENPIINRVVFEGNSKVSDETLKAEVTLRTREVYTRPKVQNAVRRVLDIYRLSGRFSAKVEPKIIKLPENRVDLIFEITEGPVTSVSKITFIGNKKFNTTKLQSIILTKESRWYRFFSSSDTYDPDRLAADRELLRQYYLKNGYADFRVLSSVAELSPNGEEFFITFTLEEGERFKFGDISLTNRIPHVNVEKLMPLLTIKKDEWYDDQEIEKTIRALTDHMGNQGYAFVDIKRKLKRNREEKTVGVSLEIVESPKVFIERIDIVGNVHTLDKVIRREIRVAEGDAYNASKERDSRRNIRELGFFQNVDIAHEKSTEPDKTIMKVEVTEKSTGSLSLGGGYSTMDGPLAKIQYNQGNLMGRGQDLRSEFWLAKYNKMADVSFTEPYFLDRRLAATVGLFHSHQSRGYGQLGLYEQARDGGMVGIGYHLTEPLYQTLRYSAHQDRISDVDVGTSRFIREQVGTKFISAVSQSLTYDKRDSRIETTSGYFLNLTNEFAGIGGQVHYLKNTLDGGCYYPVKEDWVLSLQGSGGAILGLGHVTRIMDRFSLGGRNLRGFNFGGIGPRDKATCDPLNGLNFYAGSLQLTFPLGLPNEFGVKGYAFGDVGSLWKTNSPGDRDQIYYEKSSLRSSVGVGIAWTSPMGSISLDLAHPIRKERYDRPRAVLLNIGTS
jgi:outer membrane protein insertion porin family